MKPNRINATPLHLFYQWITDCDLKTADQVIRYCPENEPDSAQVLLTEDQVDLTSNQWTPIQLRYNQDVYYVKSSADVEVHQAFSELALLNVIRGNVGFNEATGTMVWAPETGKPTKANKKAAAITAHNYDAEEDVEVY